MNTQTSIEKGDTLEKKAYELLKDLLANDDFFVNAKKSKIYWKKPYYSEKRKGNIIFDITIETFLDGADNYSTLTIFECKNLKKKVSVDDIEEFNSKISSVGEHNTKGIIITSSHLQEGAYNYAVSQRMGIARLTSNDKFDWINYRKDKVNSRLNSKDLLDQFVNEACEKENFIAVINDKAMFNFADLLLETKVIDYYVHKEKFISVPFITDTRIDEIIERLRKNNIFSGLRLDTEKLCTFLSGVYPVTFDFERILPNNLLGQIEFEPLKISISTALKPDINRWRFTLAHEVGHLILHSRILKNKIDEKTDTKFSISFRHFISDMTSRRLELQANIFASHLLLPFDTLNKTVQDYFVTQRIHKKSLYLDYQPVNQQLVFTLLNKISTDYQVSLEVAKIRLISLGLLEDDTDKSLKSILNKLKFG